MPVHHVHIRYGTPKKEEKPQKAKDLWENWYLQLTPRAKLVTVFFTEQPDCHDRPPGPWEKNEVEVQGHLEQGPVRNRATLETKSAQQKLGKTAV